MKVKVRLDTLSDIRGFVGAVSNVGAEVHLTDGNLIHFGDLSGLPDEILANAQYCVGRVCEVNGMDIDSKSGRIRHPRFVQWRDDKSPEECTWAQVQ